MRLRELAAKMSSAPTESDQSVAKGSEPDAVDAPPPDASNRLDMAAPDVLHAPPPNATDRLDTPPADTPDTRPPPPPPDTTDKLDPATPDINDSADEAFSAIDLIDRLGETMNELGEDADMVNGTKESKRFRSGRSKSSHTNDSGADVDNADQDASFDEEAPFTGAVPVAVMTGDSETEDRPRARIDYTEQRTHRSWGRREQLGDDADLAASIDEGWKPQWMLVMIIAAFCLGLGSLLIVTSAQPSDEAESDEAEIAPINVGACYGIDSFGGTLVVPCSGPHSYQIVTTYEFSGDVTPDALDSQSAELMVVDARLNCLDVFAAESSTGLPPNAEMLARVPSRYDLQSDDRTVVCEVHARPNTSLTGTALG